MRWEYDSVYQKSFRTHFFRNILEYRLHWCNLCIDLSQCIEGNGYQKEARQQPKEVSYNIGLAPSCACSKASGSSEKNKWKKYTSKIIHFIESVVATVYVCISERIKQIYTIHSAWAIPEMHQDYFTFWKSSFVNVIF